MALVAGVPEPVCEPCLQFGEPVEAFAGGVRRPGDHSGQDFVFPAGYRFGEGDQFGDVVVLGSPVIEREQPVADLALARDRAGHPRAQVQRVAQFLLADPGARNVAVHGNRKELPVCHAQYRRSRHLTSPDSDSFPANFEESETRALGVSPGCPGTMQVSGFGRYGAACAAGAVHFPRSFVRWVLPSGEAGMGVWGKTWNRAVVFRGRGVPGFPPVRFRIGPHAACLLAEQRVAGLDYKTTR